MDLKHLYPRISVSTQPAIEPVTAAEALAFFQYEGSDQASSDLAASLVITARQMVERDAAIALITQSRQMRFDTFPCGEIEIRLAPVQSITSIQYRDGNGTLQTWATDQYQSDLHSIPSRVAPKMGLSWPAVACGTMGAVIVTFVAGYGSTAADVPELAKLAIKLLAKEWFWNRCPSGEIGNDVSRAYGALINSLSWRPPV